MKKINYSLSFFGSLNGDFNVSPQSYHSAWKKENKDKIQTIGAKKAFLKKRYVSFSYGANHSHAISEE